MTNAGLDVRKVEPLLSAGGSVKWSNHYRVNTEILQKSRNTSTL